MATRFRIRTILRWCCRSNQRRANCGTTKGVPGHSGRRRTHSLDTVQPEEQVYSADDSCAQNFPAFRNTSGKRRPSWTQYRDAVIFERPNFFVFLLYPNLKTCPLWKCIKVSAFCRNSAVFRVACLSFVSSQWENINPEIIKLASPRTAFISDRAF